MIYDKILCMFRIFKYMKNVIFWLEIEVVYNFDMEIEWDVMMYLS